MALQSAISGLWRETAFERRTRARQTITGAVGCAAASARRQVALTAHGPIGKA